MINVRKLDWKPFWLQEDGPRDSAVTPFGQEYHVSEKGWWRIFEHLRRCDGMDAAKAGAQADFDAKVRECVV